MRRQIENLHLFFAMSILSVAAAYAQDREFEIEPLDKPAAKKLVVDKLPVPGAKAQSAALAKIMEVFSAEYDGATTDAKKQALARTLLAQAAKTEKDAAGMFVLLRQATEHAVGGGDVDLALEAATQVCDLYKVDPLVEKADVFKRASRLTALAKPEVAVKGALSLVDAAVAVDRFDIAKDLIRSATAIAKLKRDPAVTRDITQRNKDVILQEKQWEAASKAAAAIKQKPDDKANYETLGKYRCLVKGDWDKGLPLLAKGPFTPLRKAAELDLSLPKDPALQTKLADDWRKLAETAPAADKARLYERAKLWYETALPNLLDLDKTRVEKQIEKMTAAIADGGASGKSKATSRDILDVPLGGGAGSLRMRLIPRGQLTIGNSGRTLTVPRSFYIGVTEVTQAQWQAVMGTNPANNKRDPRLPVESVSYEECEEFAKRLSGGRNSKLQFRLPTEIEWEYACRAGATSRFPFGDDEKLLGDHEWFRGNANVTTQPVGQKKPNRAGLFDMLGNVSEWCHGGILRGSNVMQDLKDFDPARRQDRKAEPNKRHNMIGLRIVCEPQ